MTRRDILLGEQTDINDISTILGKCRIIRRKPLKKNDSESSSSSKDDEEDVEENHNEDKESNNIEKSSKNGAFYCRYNISIQPPTKSSQKGIIVITPYEGHDEEDNEDVEDEDVEDEDVEESVSVAPTAVAAAEPPTKRARAHSNVSSVNDGTFDGDGDGGDGGGGSDDDSSMLAPMCFAASEDDDDNSLLSMSDKRSSRDGTPLPITEGSGTLKIKVGARHQAIIPSQLNKRRYAPQRESPIMVWKPQSITDVRLNKYFEDATKILKDYMKKKGISMTRSLPHNVPPGIVDSDDSDRPSSQYEYREFDIDDLLYLLHDHDYNTVTALRGLKNYPEDYLYIWNKEDKELYNAGFQKHGSNLHSIGKYLTESKNHKDVVDYHYRFKIPDQFKRYQDLKREQARRMLETVERLRLNEYLSDGSNQGYGMNNGTRKSHQWYV